MSAPGAPPTVGVVRSSALAFLESAVSAPAHAESSPQREESGPTPAMEASAENVPQPEYVVPAGVRAICEACLRLYPNQHNPLQVTTRLKYWLGGHDPLDYISMYWSPGEPQHNSPPHWHYVSFGLSDLHGDGRVHPPSPRDAPSGAGCELALRLAPPSAPPATPAPPAAPPAPPLWPCALLQALARYVLTSGNKLCAGDHISWHAPLDASDVTSAAAQRPRGRIRHLLVAADPQLGEIDTPHGSVQFLQLVGCTGRELRAAQRGSGFDVLDVMSQDPGCGGRLLVTCVSRRRSARVPRAPVAGAAHLAGACARVAWTECTQEDSEPAAGGGLSSRVEQQIKATLQRGLCNMSGDKQRARGDLEGHMSTDSFEMSSIERALPDIPELIQGSGGRGGAWTRLAGVHLYMTAEAAGLLPTAINGRVLHGRHFTWRGARSVTALSPRVAGAVATRAAPYAATADWLQIVIPEDLAEDMSCKVAQLSSLDAPDSETDEEAESADAAGPLALPLTLAWPRHRLEITVLRDEQMMML